VIGLDIGPRGLGRPAVELHPTMHPDTPHLNRPSTTIDNRISAGQRAFSACLTPTFVACVPTRGQWLRTWERGRFSGP
jgi:hypothetical protein